MSFLFLFVFFKQKTAYEMRISDWSSDVCSSDLLMVANSSVNQGAGFIVASLAEARRRGIAEDRLIHVGMGAAAREPASILKRDRYDQIGRASWRERGCQYV